MSAARVAVVVFVLAAILGAVFAGVSTFDFLQHLDRQVHGAHCSFIPGLAGDHSGSSGCDVALMSPYSSVLRSLVWGGIPVSLPGLALFAFLAARAVPVLFAKGKDFEHSAGFLAAAALVPAGTSVVFAAIALFALETLCKSCMGIYTASFVCLVSGIAAWALSARGGADPGHEYVIDEDEDDDPVDWRPGGAQVPRPVEHLGWVVMMGLSVLLPCLMYVALVPDFTRYIGSCGTLEEPGDKYGVMLDLHPGAGGVDAIEVFDPLCPACKAMEERLARTGFGAQLDRKLVLFPLDDRCNWMISQAIHPGACTTSEAVLCAEDDAGAVLAWAFDNQELIKQTAEANGDEAVRTMITAAFPGVEGCLGSNQVKQRLNRSLRWAVNNRLPILTPNLFVDGVAVCQEDTDLGFTYTLAEMIERAQQGTLASREAP